MVMNQKDLPVAERVQLLVNALDGAERTNEALSQCKDAETMLGVLLSASEKLELGLTKEDLTKTPPIRDWIWFKNGGALVTVGDSVPRYQQDKNSNNYRYVGGGLVIAFLFLFGMMAGF